MFFGSAAHGIGVDTLLAGVDELLSRPAAATRRPTSRAACSRSSAPPSGERVAYVRLFAGTLRPRQRVRVGGGEEAKPTSIKVFAPAGAPRRDALAAGEMATVRGLGAVRVGDAIGEPPPGRRGDGALPAAGARGGRVPAPAGRRRAACARPSRSSPSRTRSSTSARTTTATRSRSRSTARCRRRSSRRRSSASTASPPTSARRRPCASSGPAGVGEAEEVIRAKTHTNITGRSSPLSTNPFKATLALRIEPAPFGSGIAFRAEVEPRLVPLYLFKTRGRVRWPRWRRYVREALEEGLAGWQVTDCRVTMTDCGYASPETSTADFRRLTQLVLATALDRAGTWVCEPLADLALEMPSVDGAGRPGARSAGSAAA